MKRKYRLGQIAVMIFAVREHVQGSRSATLTHAQRKTLASEIAVTVNKGPDSIHYRYVLSRAEKSLSQASLLGLDVSSH